METHGGRFTGRQVEAVANAYGDDWRALVRKVKPAQRLWRITTRSCDHVKQAQWLHKSDLNTRRVAVSMIANVIVRLREVNGYAPFDDSLPGEDPTVFEIIRAELRVLT